MNYVYDVVLNFNDYRDVYDFYEWDKNDSFIYIDKIPIFVVNTFQMEEILFSRIKISNELLSKIKNKTILENGIIQYSFLVTNREKVIGLKFNNSGELIEVSNLLLDEEEAVLEEICEFDMDYLEYEILDKCNNNLFFTRKDRYIRNCLLEEINNLYKNKHYDEISYLYYEIFKDNCSIKNKYKLLIDSITNNYKNTYSKLYDIILLSKQGILSN